MGLAKKGTSRIHADGNDYRWIVSGNDDQLDLVVESYAESGQRLWVQTDYSVGEITPSFVRGIIIKSLEKGWTPCKRATVLHLWLVGTQLASRDEIQWIGDRMCIKNEDCAK